MVSAFVAKTSPQLYGCHSILERDKKGCRYRQLMFQRVIQIPFCAVAADWQDEIGAIFASFMYNLGCCNTILTACQTICG